MNPPVRESGGMNIFTERLKNKWIIMTLIIIIVAAAAIIILLLCQPPHGAYTNAWFVRRNGISVNKERINL
jgi:hypothetical protein